MLLFNTFKYWWLYFIIGQVNFQYVISVWPLSTSNIQLLGLFQDAANASETTDLSVHSRAMFKAAILLSQQYNITIDGQFIGWQSAQTGGNIIDALSDSCQSITNTNTVGIVGPAFSREAHLIAELGERVGIPVVSYSATDPDLSDKTAYPTFYRTVPSDTSAASAIVKLFNRFNWTSCIIIYQNDVFGSSGAKIISETFVNNSLTVRDMLLYDTVAHRIRGNLKSSLAKSAARVVILWAELAYTSEILQLGLDAGVVGPLFTWILSSSIEFDSFNESYYKNLTGILTVEPVIGTVVNASTNTTLLNAAYQIWEQYEPSTYPGPSEVNNYALFAFDATWLLIQSLKKLCSETFNSSSPCYSYTGSSYCFDRRFVHSNLYLDTITNTEFIGVSGPIKFSYNETDRIHGSYYYTQNAQPYINSPRFIPVLDYSEDDGWNSYTGSTIIIWPGNTLDQPTGRAILRGVNLRIGVIQAAPFTTVTIETNSAGENITKLTGYVPELIKLLETNMGFIPDIKIAPSNQTYAQIIQSLANGDYDIIVADVTITSIRREIVAFSNAIFDNSLRLIMRDTTDVTVDLLAFLKPFSRSLWLLILGACFFAGLLFCFMERNDNEELKERSIISQLTMSIWYSFGSIVGYGAGYDSSTAAGRLLTAGLYIISIILLASYTANLASELTLQKSKGIITGIDDIKNGKIKYNRIGIREGTASQEYYLREISGRVKNYYPLKNIQDTYNKLLDGTIDVSFMDTGVAEYMTNNIYCNLTLIGDGFDSGSFGIVTPKDWLYSQDLDVNILTIRESGSLDTLKQQWFQGKSCSETAEISTAMTIESMAGLFLVFAVVCALALILFTWIKRRTIINFFMKLFGRKTLSIERKDSLKKDSIKISERSEKYKISSDEFYF